MALPHFTEALGVAPESEDLHIWRAECGLSLHRYSLVRYDVGSCPPACMPQFVVLLNRTRFWEPCSNSILDFSYSHLFRYGKNKKDRLSQ